MSMNGYVVFWLAGVLISILIYAAWVLPAALEEAKVTRARLSIIFTLTMVMSFLFSWINLLVAAAFSAMYFGTKWQLQEQRDRKLNQYREATKSVKER